MWLFASYSRKDETAVRELISDLQRAHLSVWHDQELRGGDPWWQDILRRIRQCDVFLFLLSRNSLASKPCLAELSYARALGLPILPVQVGPVGNLRLPPVAGISVVDYRERTLANGVALLDAIQQAASERGRLPEPLPEPPPVPFEYLLRLGTAIGAEQLTPDQQGDFIRQLRDCLETEEDEGVRDDARELLRALRRRPDITYRNAQAIDRLLADLAAAPTGATVRETSSAGEGPPASPTAADDHEPEEARAGDAGAVGRPGPPTQAQGTEASPAPRGGFARGTSRNRKRIKRMPRHGAVPVTRVATGGAQRLLPSPRLLEMALTEAPSPGRVLFNPPEDMRQGRVERIEVVIARTDDLDDELRKGLRGRGIAKIESISTSRYMSVDLKGKGFDVTPLSLPPSATQFVDPMARWEFDVVPKLSGLQTLQVIVWMSVPAPDRQDVRISIPVLERRVRVRIDPVYSTKQFAKNNWQWMVGSTIGMVGLGGGLTAWINLVQ